MSTLFSSDWFKSIVTLVIGWFLSEVSHYFLARGERRKAISNALSDLLEIRHQFLAIEIYIRELMKPGVLPVEVPAGVEPQLRAFIENKMREAFPQFQKKYAALSKRFDESVTLVASIDPILGYQLRSKELMQQVFQRLNGQFAQNDEAAALWRNVGEEMFRDMSSELDTYIKKLAWKLGPTSRWKIKTVLVINPELPDSVRSIFETLRKAAQQQQKPSAPSQPATQAQSAGN